MLIAGITTIALNLVRRGPEILDSFTSMLRDSPYIHVDLGPSTEDASSQTRNFQTTRVILSDMIPKEVTGHVALSNVTVGEAGQ
jgi:hypothetical protein